MKVAYVSFTDLMHHGEATSLTAHSLRELVQVVVLHAHRFVEAPLQGKSWDILYIFTFVLTRMLHSKVVSRYARHGKYQELYSR